MPFGRLRRPSVDAWISLALFAIAFVVYRASRLQGIGDSKYTLLTSEALLRHGSPALEGYLPDVAAQLGHVEIPSIEAVDGHAYYYFPMGTSVLVIPIVVAAHLFGVSVVDAQGGYDLHAEIVLQVLIASLSAAALVVILYRTARLLLDRRWSVAIALTAAFGTQLWSTAPRTLGSQTVGVFLVGAALYLLARSELEEGAPPPNVALIATLLSASWFVRPTNVVFIVAIAGMLVFKLDRRRAATLVGVGAMWLAVFVAWSMHLFHRPLPPYFEPSRLSLPLVAHGLVGNLASPGRSELLWVPVSIFAVGAPLIFFAHVRARSFATVLLSSLVAYTVMISSFTMWWGGHAYGPRYFLDVVPVLVVLATLGVDAARSALADPNARRTLARAAPFVAFGLAVPSVAIHARGATSAETWAWNDRIALGDVTPLWDWRAPQFLAGIVGAPPRLPGFPTDHPMPSAYPRLEHRVAFGKPEGDPYCWFGFAGGEGPFRWTDAREAGLTFSVAEGSEHRPYVLRFGASPLLAESIDRQQIVVTLNGVEIGSFVAMDPTARAYAISLPARLVLPSNAITLRIPGAASPESLGASDDGRLLGLAVHWLELTPE